MNFEDKLKSIQTDKKPFWTTPNEIMEYIGVSRRGWRVNEKINSVLKKYDLVTEPEFESAWKWGDIEIKPKSAANTKKNSEDEDEKDPTPRLSILRAANIVKAKEQHNQGLGLITVSKETELNRAITLMMMYNLSQLPVLSGRKVDGLISWESIGKALALDKDSKTVNDCKTEVTILNYNEPLFSAVKIILEKKVVLVKLKDETIGGIVTASDVGEQFIALAEPFLIMEQIENHIRKLLEGKFSVAELSKATDPKDGNKEIKNLSELTFGEYIRLIEDPENFKKLDLPIDRPVLIKHLNEIREIRNDVMHFDPEGVSENDRELLRQTVNFFNEINSIRRKNNK